MGSGEDHAAGCLGVYSEALARLGLKPSRTVAVLSSAGRSRALFHGHWLIHAH